MNCGRLLILAAAVMVAMPASADAAQYLNRPGDSAVDQYSEVIPTSTGSTPTGGLAAAATSGATLPPAAARALKGSGPNVRALSRFVATTAPKSTDTSRLPSAGRGDAPLSSLAQGLEGRGGGLGLAMPVLMIAAALGAVALLARARRRPPP